MDGEKQVETLAVDIGVRSAACPRSSLLRIAWLPVPILLLAIVALWAVDLRTEHESQSLLTIFNFLFSTVASLLVAVLVGRSYMVRGSPGLLLLGCGVILWGSAGTLVPVLMPHGTNALISGHNTLVWCSGLCYLAGVLLSVRSWKPPRLPGLTLAVAYAGALCLVWLITMVAVEGWMPEFFVQGQGGTSLRTFVLGSTAVMFALCAAALWRANRPSPTAFVRWYAAALLLVATGLLGIMLESVHGGALSWTARAAQFLGGAYMLVAAVASVRESGLHGVSLSEALRQSEERYHSLFIGMTEGFAIHEIITDAAGTPIDYRFLDINPAFERLTGFKRHDVIGRTVKEIMPGTDAHWIQSYGQVALSGQAARFENYSTPLAKHYEVFAYQSAPRQFAVVFTDITDRKRAEEATRKRAQDALRMSEQEFRTLAEAMPQIAWATRADGWNIYFNQQWVDYTGMTMEESYGHGWNKPFHPDDQRRAWDAWQRATKYNEPYSVECRLRRADGVYRWWLVRGSPMLGDNGEILKWFGTCTDIEEIKRAEKAMQEANDVLEQRVAERTAELRESEQQFSTLADAILTLAWWANGDGYITWYNRRWYEYTGKTPQDMEGWGWQSVHDPQVLPEVMERWKASIATGEPFDMTFPLRGADGQFRRFLTRIQPLKDAQGRVVRWFGINTDVEELKRAEEELQRTAAMLEAIGNSTPDSIFVKDRDGRMLYASPGMLQAVHKTADQVLGRIDTEWHPNPEEAKALMANDRQVMESGQSLVTEETFTDAQGKHIFLSTKSALLSAGGQVIGLVGLSRDVTDRKRAEEALQATVRDLERSNKELEQFAYVASHDLQEPLRQVRAFVGLLKDRHGDKFEGQVAKYFQFVYEGAARMSDLVQGLLAYSRVGAKDARKRPTPCQKMLDIALANLQAGIAESRARITHDELPNVLAEPTQLAQLFQNLIGNAVKFRRHGLDPQIHIGCQRDDGHWLFRVQDNGIGIDPEFHEKVFLIFQRLHGREKYAGTGIGLAICKKIVEQHGGRIWIESKPDEGSTFCFTLPHE